MRITNVVSKAAISGFEKDIILDAINTAEYRPNGFPAICVRENHITISLFDSGKITSKGACSTDNSIQSINQFIKRIRKLGMKISVTSKPTISLIVCNVSFGKRMDIASLKRTLQFKKEIKRFSAIQLKFPNNVNVQAYDYSLLISGDDITHMMGIVKDLEKYTMEK